MGCSPCLRPSVLSQLCRVRSSPLKGRPEADFWAHPRPACGLLTWEGLPPLCRSASALLWTQPQLGPQAAPEPQLAPGSVLLCKAHEGLAASEADTGGVRMARRAESSRFPSVLLRDPAWAPAALGPSRQPQVRPVFLRAEGMQSQWALHTHRVWASALATNMAGGN